MAERFGRDPDWFAAQPLKRQLDLLAYERMREQEEDAVRCPFLS